MGERFNLTVKLPISSEPASSGNIWRTVARLVRLAPCRAASRPAVKLDPPPAMPVVDALGAADPDMDMEPDIAVVSWAIDMAAIPARVSEVAACFMMDARGRGW